MTTGDYDGTLDYNEAVAARPQFTRQERGLARRVTNRLLAVEQRQFPSDSRPGAHYLARVMQDGKLMCDCRGWVVRKVGKARECKHTRELAAGRPTHTKGNGEFMYLGTPAVLNPNRGLTP
jgi:hypothetical protein